ncbi:MULTISPECIES: hypothetical protein [Natrialba]|uniref:Uncharacterized protein n=1 Tax=Natrialba aegyptia DSM 13077 TaxID=1227491 RepID=M0B2I4_9EURY|nr:MULTISPECIES: hypothetical protein [Natrialba]ELZ05106.1 hypothetical protein C480_10864 [Natrialba aegyptia DSM 13077]
MERFVTLIVAGGLCLLAGLWLAELVAVGSPPWIAGAALALCGTVAILAGIRRELTVSPFA